MIIRCVVLNARSFVEDIMRKKVLMVGFDRKKFCDFRQRFLCNGISVHAMATMVEVIETLAGENNYIMIAIFLRHSDSLSHLRAIRILTNVPIIISKEKYSGTEKIAVIEAGADEYIPWPETVEEFAASCQALLRRFTVLNRQCDKSEKMALQGGVFIHKDYRRIYIHGLEVQFTSREYEIFSLLASYPDRVFTYDYLLEVIWSDKQIATENSLHSCIRRIRRKLENLPKCTCSIENVRNVGYCFRHNRV